MKNSRLIGTAGSANPAPSQKHKTYKQLFQIKLDTHCSLKRMVTPPKKLLKAQHG